MQMGGREELNARRTDSRFFRRRRETIVRRPDQLLRGRHLHQSERRKEWPVLP